MAKVGMCNASVHAADSKDRGRGNGTSRTAKVGKVGKEKRLLEEINEDGSSSFARALGSVDFHTRDQGLRALTVFLQNSTKLTHLAFLKLWKGLFYCFWHSDKAPVQEQLATRLAAILPSLQEETGTQYFATFLETMKREWFGIDRLRLDKFMMLVRKFIHQMFVLLGELDWQDELVGMYLKILKNVIVQSTESTGQGLSLQIFDVIVTELLSVQEEIQEQIPAETLTLIFQFLIDIITEVQNTVLQQRVRKSLETWLEECQSPEDGLIQLHPEIIGTMLFSAGARKDIKVATRELLYNYSKQFEDLKLSHSLPSSPRKRKSQKGKEVSVSSPQGQSSHVDGKLEGQKKTKKQKLDEDLVKNIDTESMKEDDGIPDIKTLKKKKNEAKQKTGLDTKEVNKAASRTLAAIEAHKRGETTLHPPTPGSPKLNDFDSLFSQTLEEREDRETKPKSKIPNSEPGQKSSAKKESFSLQNRQASKAKSSKKDLSGNQGKASLLSPEKHVKISLKKNLYFKPGDVKPSPDVRTPSSCRPKGSALKQVSKFPGIRPDGRRNESPKKSPKNSPRSPQSVSPRGRKKRRKSNLGRNSI